MKTKIALVANQKNDIELYLKKITRHDVEIVVVPSFQNLEKILMENAFNGIIVDLKTKLALPKEEKELAYQIIDHYPVLQSRIIPDSNKIQGMPFGKTHKDVTLDTFISNECPAFSARKVREGIRRKLHLNVLLSKSGQFTKEDIERTVTLNISKGGCFIVSATPFNKNTSVVFIIKELKIKTPIVGEIRWCIPWGKHYRIPGIGIKFEDIQEEQIQEMIKSRRSG